jgi:hypothetical protein
LYLLVEVTGPETGRDIIADQLALVIRDIYFEQRSSVTAGLQKALQQANSMLFAENRDSLPGERRTAGASCVVLRDSDLFIAQVGPAAIFLARGEQVDRIPDLSPWLDGVPPEEMDAAALGERLDVNVSLFHRQVVAGDVILLAETVLAHQVSATQWPVILDCASVEETLDALEAASRGKDASALVVAMGGEVSAAAPVQPAPAGDEQLQAPVADDARAQVQQTLHSTWEQASGWLSGLQIGDWLERAGRVVVAALAGIWAAVLSLLTRMMPGQPAEQPGRDAKPPPAREREAKPKRRKRAGVSARPKSNLGQQILIGIAIIIPLLVAAVVLFTVVQRGQVHRAEIDGLWQEANARWGVAQTTADPATVRAQLAEAENLLGQLLELEPDHAEARELQKKIDLRLDAINQVKRVSWLGELNAYSADAELGRVVVEGSHVFVMDRRGGKVYHHQLDELQQTLQPDSLNTVLVSKGAQVGEALVADLVDMVWMPAGNGRQKANLVILESGGTLLEYDPATRELRPLTVAASDSWQFAELVGSYYGRFYVLDSGTSEILRYNPTPDGYSDPPDRWLQEQVDLIGVKDMSIGDSIYLLYADGRIRKLTAGKPDAFDISDWDTPPNNPSSIFTRPSEDTKWLYVADRGNDRIVQSTKEGLFKRQFRLADVQEEADGNLLTGVTGFFVDEIGGRAYVLSNQKLYLLILPD